MRSPASTTTRAPARARRGAPGCERQVEHHPGRARGQGRHHVAGRGLGHLGGRPPGRRARCSPPRRAAPPSSASAGTRPRTCRRSSQRRPGRCSMPAVTSSPPRSRSRSTTTDGGPVAASRRPTARARVLAPRPPEAPTTAVRRWDEWSSTATPRSPHEAADTGRRHRACGQRYAQRLNVGTCGRRTPACREGDVREPAARHLRHGTAPVGRRDPRARGTTDRPDESGHGTAPVGGTTGAVGEPSSGGEKPVRRSLNPEGERVSPSCLMTDSPRKPSERHVHIVLRSARQPTESEGLADQV